MKVFFAAAKEVTDEGLQAMEKLTGPEEDEETAAGEGEPRRVILTPCSKSSSRTSTKPGCGSSS